MQLLTKAIPKLEALNKEGEYGRKKIQQWTRLVTFPLAIIQSVGTIFLVRESAASFGGLSGLVTHASLGLWILMVASLTGGAMLLMWFGELITEQGVGNGISLVITIGIVARLPQILSSLLTSVVQKGSIFKIFGHFKLPINSKELWISLAILAAGLIVTTLVVYLNEAQRRITISYAKRLQGNRIYGGVTTTLPVRLVTAGVVPIIFALAFLSLPSFVGQLISSSTHKTLAHIGQNLVLWFQNPTPTSLATGGWHVYFYPIAYFLLVFVFTFFYTGVVFSAKDISENLQKQGGFIDGVRPGPQTESFLTKIVNRLTFFGAIALAILALLPIIAQALLKSNEIALGGTSILILVAVALETMRQLESRALMITYDDYTINISSEKPPKKRRWLFFKKTGDQE
jgi:preprotein translocase subunit SecY